MKVATARAGRPTLPTRRTTSATGAVVIDSGMLVLREGLETILVLAAVTASLRGGNGAYRRPIGLGAALAFLASVVTWFVAIAITSSVGAGSLDVQAATGLLAVASGGTWDTRSAR